MIQIPIKNICYIFSYLELIAITVSCRIYLLHLWHCLQPFLLLLWQYSSLLSLFPSTFATFVTDEIRSYYGDIFFWWQRTLSSVMSHRHCLANSDIFIPVKHLHRVLVVWPSICEASRMRCHHYLANSDIFIPVKNIKFKFSLIESIKYVNGIVSTSHLSEGAIIKFHYF